ncbi:MAG: hypothetical protein OXG78_08745 [Chloroflexi bacterium]|nr:hypothetical protein [Chloroflexota bacterium]
MIIETIRIRGDVRLKREQIMALARQHRVRRVAVFESLMRGEFGSESDIDFLKDGIGEWCAEMP